MMRQNLQQSGKERLNFKRKPMIKKISLCWLMFISYSIASVGTLQARTPPITKIKNTKALKKIDNDDKTLIKKDDSFNSVDSHHHSSMKQLTQLYQVNNSFLDSQTSDTSEVPLDAISPDTLKTFVKVIDIARREYINPVNDQQLFLNAMQGMLKNLDPHAEFLDAKSYENLQNFTQGDVAQVGIQATFNKDNEQWVVVDIEKESPAHDAGIEIGFYLHQINGVQLTGKTQDKDVKQLLQGMAGTIVDVVASNKGRREKPYRLQRILTTEQAVNVEVIRDIAIVSIPVFQENTKTQILDALVDLQEPVFGLVLDLRNNPGGLLDAAIEISSLFQSNVGVVKIENREGVQHLLTTEGNCDFQQIPIVLLQNRYSASAAEVLASSLQHTGRAKILGETSYGKGTIQSVIQINDNQAVKLTVARYLQVDGKQIDGIGVIPDIKLLNNNDFKQDSTDIRNQIKPIQQLDSFNAINKHHNNDNERNKKGKFFDFFGSNEVKEDKEAKYQQTDWKYQAVDILIDEIKMLAKKEDKIAKPIKITYPTNE